MHSRLPDTSDPGPKSPKTLDPQFFLGPKYPGSEVSGYHLVYKTPWPNESRKVEDQERGLCLTLIVGLLFAIFSSH